MTGQILETNPRPGVAVLEINAPPSNALGDAVRSDFLAKIEALNADLKVRAIVLTGRGEAFCSGDDLREASGRGDRAMESLNQFGRLLDLIDTGRLPVIAAVNGSAVGGGLELALACAIRIGSPEARFIAAGVNVGLMASVWRLPRLIGPARAAPVLLTGLPLNAQTALDYGLLTAIHPSEQLLDAAVELASRIATRAPLSVEATKRQLGQALDLDAAAAAAAAARELAILTKSEDHRGAVRAFLDRLTPTFTRR